MKFTIDQCDEVIAGLDFERDDRNPPDALRRGRFRQGWRDAAVRRKEYGTLDRLAWQSLGFRLRSMYGNSSDEDIDETFEAFAAHFAARGRVHRR